MTDLREAGELSTGSILEGRYRLVERIGEGGMARVYRAEDDALQRSVAIKVLRGPVDEVGSIERALSETTVLASLNHHSLVTLFDAHVSADDSSYLVMEYVEGATLRDLIAEGPVDPVLLASIAADIAEGLHIAHTAGVVHRDIKPSNVLLWHSPLPGPDWRAKLADFGIAYLLDSPRMTSPGIAVGTVAYIAPEQARGETPAPPADIYALGIMLIEALTGTRPFAEAEGIGTVMARLNAPPKIPDTLHPAWQGLLRGMTALRPDDRPTALEVATAAARLAANGDAAAHATAPATAVFAAEAPPTGPMPAENVRTDKTVVLPAAAAGAASVAAGEAATRRTGPLRAQRDRRRRVGVIVAIGMLALLIAIVVTAVSLSLAGAPSPEPTSPTVVDPSQEPTPQPSVEPSEEPVDEQPADEQPADDGDNSGPGNNNGNGNGNGNDNSGPGNNNGNGNGNGP